MGKYISQNLNIENLKYYLYGYSAFLLRPWMQWPFHCDLATMEQAAFNSGIGDVHVAVEHNYKNLKQLWTS